MRKYRWLLLPAALFWLTGYESRSMDECLAETTVGCAIDQAVLAARTIGDQSQRAAAYSYIARVNADTGHDADAREYLALAGVAKREVMAPNLRAGISASQARINAMLGEFGEALALAEAIDNPVAAVRAWSWIAESQARAGDNTGADRSIERALAVAAKLPVEQMAFPMAMMAVAKAHEGEHEEALAVADAALDLASRYDNDLWQARVASLVAVAQAEAGEHIRAAKSLARATAHLSRLVADGAPVEQHGSALAFIAWAEALSGDSAGARTRLEALKGV